MNILSFCSEKVSQCLTSASHSSIPNHNYHSNSIISINRLATPYKRLTLTKKQSLKRKQPLRKAQGNQKEERKPEMAQVKSAPQIQTKLIKQKHQNAAVGVQSGGRRRVLHYYPIKITFPQNTGIKGEEGRRKQQIKFNYLQKQEQKTGIENSLKIEQCKYQKYSQISNLGHSTSFSQQRISLQKIFSSFEIPKPEEKEAQSDKNQIVEQNIVVEVEAPKESRKIDELYIRDAEIAQSIADSQSEDSVSEVIQKSYNLLSEQNLLSQHNGSPQNSLKIFHSQHKIQQTHTDIFFSSLREKKQAQDKTESIGDST